MKKIHYTVPPHQAGERLDKALQSGNLGLSRRKIRAIIDLGGAYVNRKRIRVSSRTVDTGDTITLEFHEQQLTQKSPGPALGKTDLLYQSKTLIIINKPAGMPSQPTRTQARYHATAEAQRLIGGRLQLIHRLDLETSGLLAMARTADAMKQVTDQFKQRTVEKTYLALTAGIPRENIFHRKTYLSAIDRNTGVVVECGSASGRVAETNFRCLAYSRDLNVSLIACYPHTGRSHQLRVHLNALGLPILGDKKYGDIPLTSLPEDALSYLQQRHMLHAWQLRLVLPGDRKPTCFTAPVHPDFAALCSLFGFEIPVPS